MMERTTINVTYVGPQELEQFYNKILEPFGYTIRVCVSNGTLVHVESAYDLDDDGCGTIQEFLEVAFGPPCKIDFDEFNGTFRKFGELAAMLMGENLVPRTDYVVSW